MAEQTVTNISLRIVEIDRKLASSPFLYHPILSEVVYCDSGAH